MASLYFLIVIGSIFSVNSQWDMQDYGVIITPEHRYKTLWGTYKPNLYFALKDRRNTSNAFGIMWYGADLSENQIQGNITDRLRHECKMKDELTYYWTEHNGYDFARQQIEDEVNGVHLETAFAKSKFSSESQQNWSVKITSNKLGLYRKRNPINQQKNIGLVLYSLLELFTIEDKSLVSILNEDSIYKDLKDNSKSMIEIIIEHSMKGKSLSYLKYIIPKKYIKTLSIQKYRKKYEDTWRVKSFVSEELQKNELKLLDDKQSGQFAEFDTTKSLNSPNIIAVQLVLSTEFEIGVSFSTSKDEIYTSINQISQLINEKLELFNKHFDSVTNLKYESLSFIKSEDDKHLLSQMVRQAVSNVFGGIGYYWGKIKIHFDDEAKKGKYIQGFRYALDDKGLLTGSPSRSFFARGFLWDEGFHNIIISAYNMDLSMDIIDSWLSTMSATGYMAREQIRGAEQEAGADMRFLIQDKMIANPPTFIYPVNSIITHYKYFYEDGKLKNVHSFLKKVYDKFSSWYEWYEFYQKSTGQSKQAASKSSFYSWYGRNSEHNLACGLDDFPRGMTPNIYEKHLDLYIWVLQLLGTLRNLAEIFDYELVSHFDSKIEKMKDQLSAFKDPSLGVYNDFLGSQFKKVKTDIHKREVFPISWRGDNKCGDSKEAPNPIGAPYTDCNPYSKNSCCSPFGWCGSGPSFCNCQGCKKSVKLEDRNYAKEDTFNPHVGYVTLYPLIAGILDPKSSEFEKLLFFLESEDELYSKFGIRSLSKSDLLYHTGDDYWRGNIWINLNYLTLRGLYKYYKSVPKAFSLYKSIRENLVKSIFNEWKKSSLFYEQYSDETGRGLRAHPFNGWTSLIAMIISEQYEN